MLGIPCGDQAIRGGLEAMTKGYWFQCVQVILIPFLVFLGCCLLMLLDSLVGWLWDYFNPTYPSSPIDPECNPYYMKDKDGNALIKGEPVPPKKVSR
jgi:hypothetical protein